MRALALPVLLLVAGCTVEYQHTSKPNPSAAPAPAPRPEGGKLRVALLPTSVSVGEAKAGAWLEAFRQALAEDPRFEFVDSRAAEKTLERHRKGSFNAFKDVTADLWIESSAFTRDEAAYNKLTKKLQNAPQLRFQAVVRRGLDDRSGTTYGEGGRFFMNEAHAKQAADPDLELVRKVAAQVRAGS